MPLRPLLLQASEACAEPVAVVVDAPPDTAIRVKQVAVLRALDNLLANALRHGKPPVTLIARIKARDLLIDVQDTGHGITPEDARNLLRPFARGNAARAGEGTGLGLAIVAQVVRAHGGEIQFHQGRATFTVRLRLPKVVIA